MTNRPLPPSEQREEWIKRSAGTLVQVLASPELRARILELLNGNQPRTDDENS